MVKPRQSAIQPAKTLLHFDPSVSSFFPLHFHRNSLPEHTHIWCLCVHDQTSKRERERDILPTKRHGALQPPPHLWTRKVRVFLFLCPISDQKTSKMREV